MKFTCRIVTLFFPLFSIETLADDIVDVLNQSVFVGVVSISSGTTQPYFREDAYMCGLAYSAYANINGTLVNSIGWAEGEPINFRSRKPLMMGGQVSYFSLEQG